MNGHFMFIGVVAALCLGTIGIARLIDIFESKQDWHNDKKEEGEEV